MQVITETPARPSEATLAGKVRDTLRLTWEERRWTRKRVTTTGGREIALALPTGTVLEPGEILLVEADVYVEVEAKPEPVLAVFPRTHEEAVGIAFDVGNRHFTLACEGDVLLVPDDLAMEQLVSRLDVPWERREVVYAPLGGGPDD